MPGGQKDFELENKLRRYSTSSLCAPSHLYIFTSVCYICVWLYKVTHTHAHYSYHLELWKRTRTRYSSRFQTTHNRYTPCCFFFSQIDILRHSGFSVGHKEFCCCSRKDSVAQQHENENWENWILELPKRKVKEKTGGFDVSLKATSYSLLVGPTWMWTGNAVYQQQKV